MIDLPESVKHRTMDNLASDTNQHPVRTPGVLGECYLIGISDQEFFDKCGVPEAGYTACKCILPDKSIKWLRLYDKP